MSMYHHGPESYEIAAGEAAKRGRQKMEEIIHNGLASAQAVIEQVQSRAIDDRVVKGNVLQFDAANDGFRLLVPNLEPKRLHDLAMRQVASKGGVPQKYLDDLTARGDWGKWLAVDNLNEIYRHSTDRHLVRSVGNETRGFLSDRFRRIDSRPLVEQFVAACQKLGAVPIQGYALETKVRLRAVIPQVFEPVPNEVMLFGVEWGNSDFGDGGHCVSIWNMRCWCTNTTIMDEVLRQVHLGKRLDDNIEYSARTYQLDTQANSSALHDVIGHALAPKQINGLLNGFKTANAQGVTMDQARNQFKKLLLKGEADAAMTAFESPDVVNLPPGDTQYRLSNAISWIAQAKNIRPERQLELQKIAGDVLPRTAKMKAVEV